MNFSEILFHPFFVHFPIALSFFEFFLLSLAVLKKNQQYGAFARLTFYTLTVCLSVTLLAGWYDAGGSLKDLFEGGVKPHFYAACFFSVIVLTRLVLWKRLKPEHPRGLVIQIAASALMISAVIVTAYFGGKLVYS
jgi:uncharacterized membrane protein